MCMNEASDSSTSCGAGKARDFLGIGLAGHDSGVALIEMSQDTGVNMICNNEEERYRGVRHCADYPRQSLDALLTLMHSRCVLFELGTTSFRATLEERPASSVLFNPATLAQMNGRLVDRALRTPRALGVSSGCQGRCRPLACPTLATALTSLGRCHLSPATPIR